MSGNEKEHPLLLLLQEQLPVLGLDVDTYAPYILALFPFPISTSGLSTQLKESTDVNLDIEGWNDVVELLQASSDENLLEEVNSGAWMQLRKELIHEWITYQHQLYHQQKAQLVDQEQIFQNRLKEERELAIINEMTSAKAVERIRSDSAKQALLNRFGYEDDDFSEDTVGVANASGVNVSRSSTSKMVGRDEIFNATAASSQLKLNKSLSSGITAGSRKREEQQKTKLHHQQKVAAKEERRKRATKCERRK
jgi:hypothetical protein